jgi:hypothetical protein
LPGNFLCLRCHNGSDTNAPIINPVTHSFHKVFGFDTNGAIINNDLMSYKPREVKETGGECVNCHMPQTALLHYQKAVSWDPYSAPFRQQLAVALSVLNRPREAVETLREACRLNPNDSKSRYQLGLACNEAGDLDSARKELKDMAGRRLQMLVSIFILWPPFARSVGCAFRFQPYLS